MMQLFPILLVVVLGVYDGGVGLHRAVEWIGPWPALTVLIGVPTAHLIALAIAIRAAMRGMNRGRGFREYLAADWLVRSLPIVAVFAHVVSVLGLGWLEVIRGMIGDQILIDEVAAILPALLMPMVGWWLFYPIEQRLREATMVRRFDEGLPLYPLPTRLGYVANQVRLQYLLTLPPILLLMTWTESVQRYGQTWTTGAPWLIQALAVGGSVTIFALAPLLARVTLNVSPIPPGELREDLLNVCRRHRIGVRDLLVWHTAGSLINGAVMGLIAPLRYVMLTEVLVDSLPRPQLLAVMAHEVGHVRRHHLWWTIGCLLAIVLSADLAMRILAAGIETLIHLPALLWAGVGWGLSMANLVLMFVLFGWVSRRFERQADTFAAQHLSEGQDGTVQLGAALALADALETVSRLNGVDPHRASWRHGSISWRQRYLRSIVGQPVNRLGIDRLIRWIKIATVVILLACGGLAMLEGLTSPPQPAASQLSLADAP